MHIAYERSFPIYGAACRGFQGRVYVMNHSSIERKASNIVLIGMPGCGKSTLGRLIAEMSGMLFIDVDSEIENSAKKSIPKIFAEEGEPVFRRLEAVETSKAGKKNGAVIATGGGVVKLWENYLPLAGNGRIYFIRRFLPELAVDGRPLSADALALETMYAEREPLYREFSDCVLEEGMSLTAAAEFILNDFHSFTCER